MSQWLNDVINEEGEYCRNCSTDVFPVWRNLTGRELDACGNCGDESFDIYDFDEDDPY